MRQYLLVMVLCFICGCTSNNTNNEPYVLQGAWILRQVDYPAGSTDKFAENKKTVLRLYEGDSVMYQCWLTRTESTLIIKPNTRCRVTTINKGGGEFVYLEEDNPYPLKVINDSTITIQQNGVIYTLQRSDYIAKEWGEEIREIISTDMKKETDDYMHSYALSSKERKQANVILVFICSTIAIIMILLLIVRVALGNRREKRQLKLQLQQIQEVWENRPQMVRQVVQTMEEEFFASEEYEAWQSRIATGQRLKEEDWKDIEELMKRVYPGFCSQLRSLYPMSELEYQVCMLIKLRFTPTDISAVLSRDTSTISTVRSRLYKKVFGRKGGAKEWDEFILSIGT